MLNEFLHFKYPRVITLKKIRERDATDEVTKCTIFVGNDKRGESDIIKVNSEDQGLTITDIKHKGHAIPKGLVASCGEKTLQRELISMVKDNMLYKTGEKRWSRYFVKK